jgi:hypothetical protein
MLVEITVMVTFDLGSAVARGEPDQMKTQAKQSAALKKASNHHAKRTDTLRLSLKVKPTSLKAV